MMMQRSIRTASIFVSALTTLTLFVVVQRSSSSEVALVPNKLLVVLVDGFRWDYFDKFSTNELPGFNRLRQIGVTPDAFVPAFPSLSFPNYYSIMTGTIVC